MIKSYYLFPPSVITAYEASIRLDIRLLTTCNCSSNLVVEKSSHLDQNELSMLNKSEFINFENLRMINYQNTMHSSAIKFSFCLNKRLRCCMDSFLSLFFLSLLHSSGFSSILCEKECGWCKSQCFNIYKLSIE